MSYTVVPTVSTGDVWTASNHNLYIRDNFRAVVPDVITAKGELVIGDGADALALLSVGADSLILSGDLTWINPVSQLRYGESTGESYAEGGSGNIHIPTYYSAVPESAGWIYCMIELRTSISTAYFALHPSHDTTLNDMIISQMSPTTAENWSQCHGVVPLDSTGGLFYTMSDTALSAMLKVYAWMY